MIGISVIIAVCITLFITLPLPLILYVILGLRSKGQGVWTAWLLGAAGFFVTQIVVRTPILSVLSLRPGFQVFVTDHYVMYCLILAFTAALFEVIGRVVVARILCREYTAKKAFAAGLGHGSIEAMVIVGMTYVNNLLFIFLINSGAFGGIIEQTAAAGLDTAELLSVQETILSTPALTFYLGGYERILSVTLHIALTMIVCYCVSRKKTWQGIFLCLGWHWATDFIAPLINGLATPYLGNRISQTTAYALVYVFLTATAIAAILVIRRIRAEKPQGS